MKQTQMKNTLNIGQSIKFYAVEIAGELDTWAANINPNGCNTKVLIGQIIDINDIAVCIKNNSINQWVLNLNIIA